MTSKQRTDLECIKHFIPRCMKDILITEEDERDFLSYSERGMFKDRHVQFGRTGFDALCEGKRWRGIHVHEMYEQGIMDGSVPYCVLVEGLPRVVVDFLKKEMFEGNDAELIEMCYNS